MSRFDGLIPRERTKQPEGVKTALMVGEQATGGGLSLLMAKALKAMGAGGPTSFEQTGWFQGPEGKWRREIDDSGARFENGRLVHPDLEKAYPGILKDIPMEITNSLPEGTTGGYDPSSASVLVAEDLDDPMPTALHEYQHAIQAIEGFARGSYSGDPDLIEQTTDLLKRAPNDDDMAEAYYDTGGEMESFGIEQRIGMSPKERRAQYPWEAYSPVNFMEPIILGQDAQPMKYEDTGLAKILMRALGREKTPKDWGY